MPSELRIEKLNNLFREELAKIIDRELEFPEGVLVTITKVETSPDGHYADVLLSIFGKKEREAMENLRKNVYTIQHMLNRKMRIRPVPKIRFAVDESEEKREGVEKSLMELKKKKEI